MTSKGELLLFHPNTPRSYEPVGNTFRWNLLWVHFQFSPDWKDLLQWPEIRSGIARLPLTTLELRRKILADLSEIVEVKNILVQYQERFSINRLGTALIRCQSALLEANEPGLDLGLRRDTRDVNSEYNQKADTLWNIRMERVRGYVYRTAHEKLTVGKLASVACMSERNFAREFQRRTLTTPMAFVRNVRLEKASNAIAQSKKSFRQIAHEVGFRDEFEFSRVFRRLRGFAPSSLRENPPKSASA